MSGGVKVEEEGTRAPPATIFVSDPSAEAERISSMLRAAGFVIVDVPLSMLVARVAVQKPRVVVADADAEGALDVVTRMRELPDADDVHVIFLGRTGSSPAVMTDEGVTHEASGFFPRPVDQKSLLQKIELLVGPVKGSDRPKRDSVQPPPPSLPISSVPPSAPSSRASTASLPPASMRQLESQPSIPPLSRIPQPLLRTSQKPPTPSEAAISMANEAAKRAIGASAPLSPELEQLLVEAEQRVPIQVSPESVPPTPEEEIEAVLPAELLEALDEPLGEDDDDEGEVLYGPPTRALNPSALSPRGSLAQPTAASVSPATTFGPSPSGTGAGTGAGTGTGAGAASSTTGAARRSDVLTPLPPKTHGGTHSGDTGSTHLGSELHTRHIEKVGSEGAPITQPPSSHPPHAPHREGSPRGVIHSHPPPTAYSPMAQSERAPIVVSGGIGSAPATPLLMEPVTNFPPVRQAPSEPTSTAGTVATVLGPGDSSRALARAIASRLTGAFALESAGGTRRALLREGDLVTVASTFEEESLLAYLGARGELPKEVVRKHETKFPQFGRHAGAALVAHGYLRQDQLWPVLRGHAEWILSRFLHAPTGTLAYEAEPPGRLRGEPGVFGGSTGAEVFVEVLRRVINAGEALTRLGGPNSRIAEGENAALLTECALGQGELDVIANARGRSLQEISELAPGSDIVTVIYAITLLGVVDVLRGVAPAAASRADAPSAEAVDAIDEDAIRARITARLQLVDEGDYFTLLGVSRQATGYEVKRAFLELRREFEPSRVLTPRTADLVDEVRKIVAVLEEAYEILKDNARRERYRRAIDTSP